MEYGKKREMIYIHKEYVTIFVVIKQLDEYSCPTCYVNERINYSQMTLSFLDIVAENSIEIYKLTL